MFGATFSSSNPRKMRLQIAPAHLSGTSCFARHVKRTCCVVPCDPLEVGSPLSFFCPLTLLKPFCLPENLNIYRSPLSVIHILSFFPFSSPSFIVSLRPLLRLHSFNTHLLHTDTVTGMMLGPRETGTDKTIPVEHTFSGLIMYLSHT